MSKYVLDSLYLFNQSEFHRQYTLSDFNHYAVFPLLHGRMRIYYEDEKPVSLVSWCWLSDQKAALFLNNEYAPTEEDYSLSIGDQLWGMDFIAPFGHAFQTMKTIRHELDETYGAGTAVRWRRYKNPNKLHKRIF